MFKIPAIQLSPNVLSHWYVHVENMHFSAQEFYDSITEELTARKVPRLDSKRVEFHEGGAISDKRIYLRLSRERYAFDVCAAPFGTGYFFSLRLVEKERSWWQLLVCLGMFFATLLVVAQNSRSLLETSCWILGGILVVIWGVRWFSDFNAGDEKGPSQERPAASGLPDFDSILLNTAVVGPLYERTRSDTYFRHDTRLLFQTLVTGIVKKKVDEVTAAKGVKLLNPYEYSPVIGELYKRTTEAQKAGATKQEPDAVN